MRLTKRKAINITIELWEWLAETADHHKDDWPGWKEYGRMASNCALCEYSKRHNTLHCFACPYHAKFGLCFAGRRKPYNMWTESGNVEYAELFLEQLKQL